MRVILQGLTICTLILTSASCSTPPKWDGKWWSLRPVEKELWYKTPGGYDKINLDSDRADGYVCLTTDDWLSFDRTFVQGCKAW